MKCKICKRAEADNFFNCFNICKGCREILRDKKTTARRFIYKRVSNTSKSHNERVIKIYIKSYPMIMQNKVFIVENFDIVRQEIIKRYDTLLIKPNSRFKPI